MTDRPRLRQLQVACTACGKPMVMRKNKATGGEFLGCSGWPECTETQPVPAYIHMQRQGADPLPGF